MNFSAAELNGIAAALKKEHERRQCRRLVDFTRKAWPIVEGGVEYVHNWHIDVICEHLEAVSADQIGSLLVNIPPGCAKPVWVGSNVFERTRGRIRLDEVLIGDAVLTHKGRFRRVLAIHEQGVLPLLEIETLRGRVVRVAADHPLLTARGWIKAVDLTLADVLAETHPQEAAGTQTATLEEARLLGYLIGDGGVSYGTIFTNQDDEAIADAVACGDALGFDSVITTKPGISCETVSRVAFKTRRKTQCDCGKPRAEKRTLCQGCWSAHEKSGSKRPARTSEVYEWLEKHDLRGKNSYTKRVPRAILCATDEVVADFLAAYWACDGGISDRRDLPRAGRVGQTTQSVRIDCTTVSEGLARDLQHLLSRLGLSFALRRKTAQLKTRKQGDVYVSWQVCAADQDTAAKFMQVIGARIRHEKRTRAAGLTRTKFDTALTADAVREIRIIEPAECRCLTVDEDSSFTIDEIAVHNSALVNVMWPTWSWTQDPTQRFFSASYGAELSTRDAVNSRLIIESEWYQRLFGAGVTLDASQNQKTFYQNTSGGWRLATSVGGRGTGLHPDKKIIDDPLNVKSATSDVERAEANRWYDQTLSSRGVTRGAKTVVVMQRIHQSDLSGHIIESENFRRDWTHICLPMRYERGHPQLCKSDSRTVEGDLLWPALFTEARVRQLESTLGEYGVAGQLQQRPSPAGGGILKLTEHLRLWPSDLPLPDFEFVLQSYDTAFTKDTQNDPTACTVFAIFTSGNKRNVLIVDYWTEHMEYPELRERVQDDWMNLYGGRKNDMLHPPRRPDVVLIEDKGSGKSLIQDLQAGNVPATKYDPLSRDKISRAHQVAPIIEMGIVWVLESAKQPGKPITWVRPLIAQGEAFPNDDHDDGVDTLTQGLIYLNHTRMLELPMAPDDEPEEQEYRKKRGNPYGSRHEAGRH